MFNILRLSIARLGLCALVLFFAGQYNRAVFAQSGLTLTQPAYDCATGAITFNTTGGNGSPITYSAPGITRSDASSNTGTVELGVRLDPKPLVITATQNGVSTTYTFNLSGFCSGSNFALIQPTYNCSTGAITFNTTGGDGSSITYNAPGVTRTSPASNTGTVEAGVRLDSKVVVITATQGGSMVVYRFDLVGFCGATPPSTPPVFTGVLSATGTVGSPFTYTLPAGTFTNSNAGQTLTYTASSLPTGLNIDGGTGTITGTPSASGTSSAILTATNSGGQSASGLLSIVITSSATSGSGTSGTGTVGVTPVFNGPLASVTGVVGRSFSYSLPAGAFTAGGSQSLTYGATGLPAGLTLNAATGAITGTPTTAGSSSVVLTATNSSGTSGTATSGTAISGTATSGTATSGTATSGTATVGQSVSGLLTIVISASGSGGRVAASEELPAITIRAVGGNPIANGLIDVDVIGAENEVLQVQLMTMKGEVIGYQRRERAQTEERFQFDVSRQSAGTILLRAVTATRVHTIRLLKVD